MTLIASFSLAILYGQLLAFSPSAPHPGLLWTDEHVAQGFAWSEGAVSFGIPDHDGESVVSVLLASEIRLPENALWAVKVPFVISEGAIRIGSIISETHVPVPDGPYDLVFTAQPGENAEIAFNLSLTFVANPDPGFSILKQGNELTSAEILRFDAKIAR